MPAMDRIPMTRKGYEQLQGKLHRLEQEEMPRLQKALGDAREKGDLSENAEFDAAREEIWHLEQILGELADQLARADILDDSETPADQVAIGRQVKVENLETGKNQEFVIVGEGERRQGLDTISLTSPLGQAFNGKKVGEVAEAQVPRGLLRFRILEVRPS